jgi:hypothetical protein
MWKISAVWICGLAALVILALGVSGCGSEKASSPIGSGTAGETSAEGLPSPVAETRSAIIAAAEAGDYEQLRSVLDPKVFLSDFGFGTDPMGRWQDIGPKPLETMDAMLRMPYAIRETNEGTLYQWPRFDPNSKAEDVSPQERKLLLTFMTEEELATAFNPDLGYTAPRLGILADGNWWFFILEGEGAL